MDMRSYLRQYNKLSDKEKIQRLEVISQRYADWLGLENWKLSPFLDVTKYWQEFECHLEKDNEEK